jgi:sec-independent protein translocase protein TatA
MPNLGGWELVILIGVLVLLFGAKRLPDMARSIGQSARVFKGEMKGMKNDDPVATAPEPPAAPAPLPPAQPSSPPNTPSASAPGQTAPEPSRITQPGQPGQ